MTRGDDDEEDRDEPLWSTTVPFKFTDEDLERKAELAIREALDTYDPKKETAFTTWFVTVFKRRLQDLYETYHGRAFIIKDRAQFNELHPGWNDDFTLIPKDILELVPADDIKARRWLSPVVWALPDRLTHKCIKEILNWKSKKAEDSARKRLQGYLYGYSERRRVPGEFVLYSERFRKWSYYWQGGRKWPKVSDGYVGDIVLDSGLLTVAGYADPTPVGAMDKDPVPPWELGFKLLPRPMGECNASSYIKDADLEWETDDSPFYVFHHVVKPVSSESVRVTPFPFMQKVYCKKLPTRTSLLGYNAIMDAAVMGGWIKPKNAHKLLLFGKKDSFFE